MEAECEDEVDMSALEQFMTQRKNEALQSESAITPIARRIRVTPMLENFALLQLSTNIKRHRDDYDLHQRSLIKLLENTHIDGSDESVVKQLNNAFD